MHARQRRPGKQASELTSLDRDQLKRDDPIIAGLHDIFIRAYKDEPDALALAGQVGILAADIERYPKLRLTWWSILEEAAREHQLRRMVDLALRDGTIAAWHTQIREIISVPAGPLVTADESTIPSTDEERRAAALRPTVGMRADLWEPGTILKIRFLHGSRKQKDKVEAAAMQWLQYANLKFEFGDDSDAPIRVSFDQAGSWAYLAKDCLQVPKDQPTANFGWLTDTTPLQEVERVVIHEFGHVLGLQHEHGNPASTIRWNKQNVYKTLGGPPNFWSRATVDTTIFSIWPPSYFPVHKVFDRDSIMMFPQPKEFLLAGEPIGLNTSLSALDKQFVAALYPLRLPADK